MHLLQGLTKLATHGTLTISKEHLERLARREIRDKTVAEKIELVLRWFSRKTMYVSEPIRVEPDYDYPAAFCAHPTEWQALLRMISEELGLLHFLRTSHNVIDIEKLYKYQGLGVAPEPA